MRSKKIVGSMVFLVFVAFSVLGMAGSRNDHGVIVTVYKQVSPVGVIYTYSVKNQGKYPVVSVSIGFDNYEDTSELGGELPTNIQSPSNWTGEVITVEESNDFELHWNTKNALLPGQTVTGLRVGMVKEDDRYVNSHWTATLKGTQEYASSLLQLVEAPVIK